MKVSASQPFQIIYSLYLHEYLGFIFESYIVHLDEKGKLTYQHQNISSKNAREFSKGLDDRDFELIEIMDSMHQEALVKKFSSKLVKPEEFLAKVYDKSKGSELIQEQIEAYMEKRRAKILEKLRVKCSSKWATTANQHGEKLKFWKEKLLFNFTLGGPLTRQTIIQRSTIRGKNWICPILLPI